MMLSREPVDVAAVAVGLECRRQELHRALPASSAHALDAAEARLNEMDNGRIISRGCRSAASASPVLADDASRGAEGTIRPAPDPLLHFRHQVELSQNIDV